MERIIEQCVVAETY